MRGMYQNVLGLPCTERRMSACKKASHQRGLRRSGTWRCRWESHPRMGVLQTPALLLGYGTNGENIIRDERCLTTCLPVRSPAHAGRRRGYGTLMQRIGKKQNSVTKRFCLF